MPMTESPHGKGTPCLIDEIGLYRDILTDIEGIWGDAADGHLVQTLEQMERSAIALHGRQQQLATGDFRLNVAVVGNFSAGKSLFVNSLLGDDLCPTGVCPTTSSVASITYGDRERIHISRPTADAWVEVSRHLFSRLVCSEHGDKQQRRYQFRVYYPLDALRPIEIVDTPGFENHDNAFDTMETLAALDRADVLFFLKDANRPDVTREELNQLDLIRQRTSHDIPCYLIINKADLCTERGRATILEEVGKRDGRRFKDVLLYSAKHSRGGDDALVEASLHTAIKRALDDLRAHRPFDLVLRGRDSLQTYDLIVGLNSFALPKRQGNHVASRTDVLNLLTDIALNKSAIAQAGLTRQLADHARNRRHGLHELVDVWRDRPSHLPSSAAFGGIESLRERYQQHVSKLVESLLDTARYLPHVFTACIETKTVTPGGLFSTKTVRIEFDLRKAFCTVADSSVLDAMGHSISHTIDAIENDLHIAGRLPRPFADLKSDILEAYGHLFDDVFGPLDANSVPLSEMAARGRRAREDLLTKERVQARAFILDAIRERVEIPLKTSIAECVGEMKTLHTEQFRQVQATIAKIVSFDQRFDTGCDVGRQVDTRPAFYLLILHEICCLALGDHTGGNRIEDFAREFWGESDLTATVEQLANPMKRSPHGRGFAALRSLAPIPKEYASHTGVADGDPSRRALLLLLWHMTELADELLAQALNANNGSAIAHHVAGLSAGLQGNVPEARLHLSLAAEQEPYADARLRIGHAIGLITG
jgi:hypothetical protein